jgi:hypothetical protein
VIGLRTGFAVGARVGIAVGMAADPLAPGASNPLAGVTRDAASGIYCPASAGEWVIVLAAAGIVSGGPSAIYLLQDPSGNPADAIGGFTLTASGAGLAYAQSIPGWTRSGIVTTAGSTGLLQNSSASLPDISTTSHLALSYVKAITQAVATRDVVSVGAVGTTMRAQSVATTGQARGLCAANPATGTIDSGGAVRPWVVGINRTTPGAALYTDAEKILPAISAGATGKGIQCGNVGSSDVTAAYLYRADFFAGAAELSAAQVKTLLQTLGWSPLFT